MVTYEHAAGREAEIARTADEKPATMKVVIFGAGGRTGQLLVQKALAAGHEVTAAARRPDSVREQSERLRTVCCDLFDAASVAHAIAGQQCIFVAVAPNRPLSPTTIFSTGIKNIIAGARVAEIRRVLVLGSCGVDSTASTPWYLSLLAKIVVQPLLFSLYVDTARMEGLLEMSDMDWTVVRPPLLTNRPGTSRYRVGIGQHLQNVTSIARSDVAEAMLRMANDPATSRRWVEVSS
jgi:putative NADH-flavin reductase